MYKKVKKMKTNEAAYLAGIVDGEGTITLTMKQKNAKRHLVVSIASNERSVLEYVVDIIGAGKITNKTTYKQQHKPSFAYQISNRQALEVLRQIYKELRTYKKKRAELVLKNYVMLTPRNGKYTKEVEKRRSKFENKFFTILPN